MALLDAGWAADLASGLALLDGWERHLDWLVEILTSRGLPAGTVPPSLACFLAVLPDDLPRSRKHLTAAVEAWVTAGA